MGCFGGAGDRYQQQMGTVPRHVLSDDETHRVIFNELTAGTRNVAKLQETVDRQKAILNDIEKYCQQVIKCLSIPGYVAPRPGDFSREILGMIRSWNSSNLDPNCPSCQCGGQLCTEHGTGKLETH